MSRLTRFIAGSTGPYITAAIVGAVFSSWVTYKVTTQSQLAHQNKVLVEQIEQRNTEDDARLEQIKLVEISNTKFVTELYEKMQVINDNSDDIKYSISQAVGDSRTCDLSSSAVELLNTQTATANGNSFRLPSTSGVVAITARGDTTDRLLTQQQQIEHQVEQLRVCGVVREKYKTLIEWIQNNQLNQTQEIKSD